MHHSLHPSDQSSFEYASACPANQLRLHSRESPGKLPPVHRAGAGLQTETHQQIGARFEENTVKEIATDLVPRESI